MKERVQKILAKAGIASRRKAEELILEGLVTINGKLAQLGDKAEMGKDAIKVKGKLLQAAETPIYLAFNKPRQVISMFSDPEGRPTLEGYLSRVPFRLFPVGRLDFMSEGLLLLTNDGDFAEKMQRRDDIPRVYQVKVKGHPAPEMLQRLEKGARLGRRILRPHSIRVTQELANKVMVEVVLIGAGVMDVKAFFEIKGFLVDRIVRTAIGHLTLKGLAPGEFRYLKPSQAEAVLNQPELGMKRLEMERAKAKPLPSEREERRERRFGAKPARSGRKVIRVKRAR